MRIVFDADGVLVDYTSRFLQFAGLALASGDVECYDLTKLFKSAHECYNTMREFGESSHIQYLNPLASSRKLILLRNLGYDLSVLTQMSTSIEARARRVHNLSELYGPVFSTIDFTERGQCKLEVLAETATPWNPAVLVEDNPDIILKAPAFREHNVYVIGIRHSYNTKVMDEYEAASESSAVFNSTDEFIDRLVIRTLEDRRVR